MSDRQRVESLAREADLYRNQGFLVAAKKKYTKLLQFIQSHDTYSKNEKLISAVEKKIQSVEKDMSDFKKPSVKPQLSEETQNLIQKLFSFSKNKETSAMEGAVALAKFGQYQKALKEFTRLMEENILPLEAAKNILRCHLSLSPPDVALAQYKSWVSREDFPPDDMKYLRRFLENLLDKRGIKIEIPEIVQSVNEVKPKRKKKSEEEVLDISSVGVPLKWGPLKGEMVEFEVSFQSGNTISVVVPSDQTDLLEAFKPGLKLQDMQCYSLIAVFNGTGVISGKSRITSGPKRGDVALDITISGD
jgi:tetratricopeptide (TPR) repeat protein